MKKIFILLFVCIVSISNAQTAVVEEEEDTVELKKNFFLMSYSIDQNYRMVYTDNGMLDGHQKYTDAPELKSYSTACGWAKQFNKHIVSDIGIEYSFKRVKTPTLYFPLDTTGMKESSATYTNDISFVNIPVGVSYAVGKKVKFGAYSGIALKFKISDSKQFYKSFYPDSGSGNSLVLPTKTDNFNVEFRISAFVEYNFKYTKIRVSPIYRMDLMNTYKNTNLKKSHSMGIGFSILV